MATPEAPSLLENHSMLSRSKSKSIIETFQKKRLAHDSRLNRLGVVTEAELNLTRLPASLCLEVNRRAANNLKGQKISSKCNGGASNEFYIKTTDTKAYGSSLSTPFVMQVYPKSMCPNREDHLVKIYLQKLDLPLACPTCWSLQRNAWSLVHILKKRTHHFLFIFFIHLFLSDLDGFSYNKYRYQQIKMIIHEHGAEWWQKWWSKIALKQCSWKCITKMLQDCYAYNKCQITLSQDCFKNKSTSIECLIMMMFKDCFNKTESFMLKYFNLQRCDKVGQVYKQMSIHLHLYTLINLTYK